MSTGALLPSIVWSYVPKSGENYNEENLYKALDHIKQDQDLSEIKDIGEGTFDNITGQIDKMVDIAQHQYNLLLEFLASWEAMPDFEVDKISTAVSLNSLPDLNWTPYAVEDIPVLSVPGEIAPLEQEAVETPVYDAAPVFDAIGQFPELDFTGVPDVKQIDEPGNPPALSFLTAPDELPAFTMPDSPSLHEVVIPNSLELSYPAFTGTMPVDDVGDIPSGFSYYEPAYLSNIFDTLSGKLIADLEASSSGIDTEVEDALYNRAIDKLAIEVDRQQQDVEDYFAAKGFSLPQGAMSGRLLEIQSSAARAHAGLLSDIVVQRSNLVQQNIQTLISGAIGLEGLVRQAFDNVQARSLESRKYTVDSAVALYNARVEKLKTDMQAYQIESEVFRNQIQAEAVKVDAFKSQVEAAKVSADVRESLIKAYLAELESVKTLVEVYRIRVDTVKVWADAESSKINAYKSEVEAYATRVAANELGWKIYDTKVRAQATRAGAYGELVKAYATTNDAWKTSVQAQIDKSRLTIDQNNLRLSKYSADIEKFQQDVAMYLGRISSHVQVEDLKVRASGVHADGEKKRLDSKAQNEALKVDVARIQSGEAIAHMQAQLNATLEQWRSNVDLLKTKGTVLAQIAASALSTFNTNMNYGHSSSFSGSLSRSHSVGHSESTNWSQSLSNAFSRSFSDNRSESWVYNPEDA